MSTTFAVTDATFEEEVLKADQLVIVDFWATWCGPCKMIAPILEELAGEFGSDIKVTKIDVDSNNAVAAKFGIMSIPSLVFFRNGEEVDRIVGAIPKSQLQSRINKALGKE